jgi:hypothetical protein
VKKKHTLTNSSSRNLSKRSFEFLQVFSVFDHVAAKFSLLGIGNE